MAEPATNGPITSFRTGLEGTDKPIIGVHRVGGNTNTTNATTDKDGKPGKPSQSWAPGKTACDPLDIDLQKFLDIQKQLGGKAEDVEKFLNVREALANARKEVEARAATLAGKGSGTEAGTGAATGTGSGGDGKTDAEKAAELVAKQGLDNKFTDVSGIEIKAPTAPAGWGAQYVTMDKWDTPVKDAENPHTLTDSQWGIILKSNKTMYGFVIREVQNDVVKARAAAFDLKGQSGSTSPNTIPEFEVYDCSSISIKETRTSLQKSLAENGFTSNSVESAVSGGAFGVSAGISAALRTSSSSADASNDQSDDKEYYATYNFSRVRLFMDEQNLKISAAYDIDLKNIEVSYDAIQQEKDDKIKNLLYDQADQQLQRFSKKYGHIFATSFQLGGQLQGTKSASSLLMQKESDKRDALKSSVAVSFSSMYASGSAKYSYENQTHTNEQEQSIQDLFTLAWTARGGNTLVCANPPQWAGTVGSHESWRVIEQEEVLPLHTLIGRFGDTYSKVPKLFEDMAQRKIQQKKDSLPAGSWRGKIILRLPIEKKRLALNDVDSGTVIATNQAFTTPPPEAVFTVLSANFDDTGKAQPVMSQLLADYPLFLVTGNDYSRDKEKGNQIQGLWVNSSGQLKPETAPNSWICRWSFRKPQYTVVANANDTNYPLRPLQDIEMNAGNNQWNPLSNTQIKDGDFVQLYCHSVNYGVFRDLTRPPLYGSRVLFDDGKNQFVALGFNSPDSWGENRLYDIGKESPDQLSDLYKRDSTVRGIELVAGGGILSRPTADLPDHINWKEQYGYNTKAIFQVHFVQE